MLRRLLEEYHPRLIGIVFDAPGRTFRDDLYPDYKANRAPTPEDLQQQIPLLYDVIRAMGLPLLIAEGVEADDVIGTLARQATEQQLDTLVSTGDKDMAQLVNEHVTLINTMSDTRMNPQGVMDKFGVTPEQMIDYLALVGDKVDNIPGVPSCGPKTAAKWLAEYGSLDAVVENAASIKGKVGEKLRQALDQLPLSRQLTTIKTDLALDLSIQELKLMAKDVVALRKLFSRIESSRLLSYLVPRDEAGEIPFAEPPKEAVAASAEPVHETLLTKEDFHLWLWKLKKAELFAFDTETTSLNYMQAEIVGVSFAIEPGSAAYVPVAHSYPGAPVQLDRNWVLDQLKPLLENRDKKKVGQNLKYDMNILARYGIELRGIAYDTMLESYVLDSTATRHDMDSLAEKYLDRKTIHFEDIAGKGAKQLTFDQIPLEQAGPYAAEDADITLQLHLALWPRLDREKTLSALFQEIEVLLVPVLSRIERTGVRINRGMLAEQSGQLAERLHGLEQQAYALAGHPFNMGSPKQISHIFFEELDLPVISKTPKGVPSTSESVLQALSEQGHALPSVLLEHRGLAKLKSTYTDKLPGMVDPVTGRLHTSYHQAVAATGRLSSSDPNLQNIPARTEEGRRIRRAFIPAEGYSMVAADYSQIELRIMAHLSKDKALLKAFAEGQDIHRATAAEVFTAGDMDAVTPDQRRSAKAINFGLIYGMSAFGLAKQLGVQRAEAQDYVDLYFERYPGVKEFMDRTRTQAHDMGYVETLFGRRLYLPEINSRNKQRQAAAERTAINAPMQGTAADIIKRAMLSVDQWLQTDQPAVRMLMQVHDELVFEVQDDQLESSCHKIRDCMESAARLSTPLVVDIGIGANWEEAH